MANAYEDELFNNQPAVLGSETNKRRGAIYAKILQDLNFQELLIIRHHQAFLAEERAKDEMRLELIKQHIMQQGKINIDSLKLSEPQEVKIIKDAFAEYVNQLEQNTKIFQTHVERIVDTFKQKCRDMGCSEDDTNAMSDRINERIRYNAQQPSAPLLSVDYSKPQPNSVSQAQAVSNGMNLPWAQAEYVAPLMVEAHYAPPEPSASPVAELAPKPAPKSTLKSRTSDPYDLVGQAVSKFQKIDADIAHVIGPLKGCAKQAWDAFLAADTQQARRDLNNELASDTLDLRTKVSGAEEHYQDQQRKSLSPRPPPPGAVKKIPGREN